MTSLDEPRLPSAGDPESSSWTDRGAVAGVALVSVITLVIVGAPAAAAGIGLVATFVALVGRQMFDVRSILLLAVVMIFFFPVDRYQLPIHLPLDLEPYRMVLASAFGAWIIALLVDSNASVLGTIRSADRRAHALDTGVRRRESKPVERLWPRRRKGDRVLRNLPAPFLPHSKPVREPRSSRAAHANPRLVRCDPRGFALIEVLTSYNIFSNLSCDPRARVHPERGRRNNRSSWFYQGVCFRRTPDRARGAPCSVAPAVVLSGPGTEAMGCRVGAIGCRRRSECVTDANRHAARRGSDVLLLSSASDAPSASVPRSYRRCHRCHPSFVGIGRGRIVLPEGGLLAEQSNTENDAPWGDTNGRLTDLSIVIREWSKSVLVGEGFGTRPVDSRQIPLGDGRYSGVLDNQWLGLLLEVGAVGVAAWLWLLGRTFRHLHKIARTSEEYGFLAVSLTASTASFAVCMYFLDVLTFAQFVLSFFMVLGVAAIVVDLAEAAQRDVAAPGFDPPGLP